MIVEWRGEWWQAGVPVVRIRVRGEGWRGQVCDLGPGDPSDFAIDALGALTDFLRACSGSAGQPRAIVGKTLPRKP